jgi:acylphosphatase
MRIEGLVQGVGFRAWVQRTAASLGLDGWVRNRRDGGVEVVVKGAEQAVARMTALCHDGPPGSDVSAVTIFDERDPVPPGFEVRPTGCC